MYKDQQLLIPIEKDLIVNSIEHMYSQGQFYQVSQVCHLALEILKKRLLILLVLGINWVFKFLACYLKPKSKFSMPKNYNKIVAKNPVIITQQINLFLVQICQYKIKEVDIYNINNKGYTIGLIRKTYIIILKYKQIADMMQDRNRK